MLQPTKTISGTVKLPGSKSLSNRILLLAALAEGETLVKNLLVSWMGPVPRHGASSKWAHLLVACRGAARCRHPFGWLAHSATTQLGSPCSACIHSGQQHVLQAVSGAR